MKDVLPPLDCSFEINAPIKAKIVKLKGKIKCRQREKERERAEELGDRSGLWGNDGVYGDVYYSN